MNFQIYQLAYRYEIVNCSHVCMQDMTCNVMDWVCPIFRGVENSSSLVSAMIGWIYYLIYRPYTLWWLHNASKEPYFYSRCLNFRCLYAQFIFFILSAKPKMLQKLEIHFATLSATSMVTTAKTSKNAVKFYGSVWWSYHFIKWWETWQWQQPASQWQKQRKQPLD